MSMPTSTGPGQKPGEVTLREIFSQPSLWPTTLQRVQEAKLPAPDANAATIVTGSGTSAYAADAIARAWPGPHAIPSGDLLLASKDDLFTAMPALSDGGLLVSVARSGDSPESVGVVKRLRRLLPEVRHMAITCNASGALANFAGVESIVLDPRTNDRSLVMTSSFTNLVLAGLCLTHAVKLSGAMNQLCERAEETLPQLSTMAEEIAQGRTERVAILASGDLRPLAAEISLKILEMTAGAVTPIAETFLGLRHGPMSFLRADTLVLCWMSSDPSRRRYEEDLIEELRSKGLGRLIIVGGQGSVPALAPTFPDRLRVPFEAPFGQLLGYHLSLQHGLNPDDPSPGGVITRVVRGFRLHEDYNKN